ncbi:MAG: PKD domain-containing protein [Bacteroidetes bacterium]|jgi:PKD repeat protein|nr:PKD domain-containing protein [Bacteroidota bacterium]
MKQSLILFLILFFSAGHQLFAQEQQIFRGKAEAKVSTSFDAIKANQARMGDNEYNQFKKPNPFPMHPEFEIDAEEVLSLDGKLTQTGLLREISPAPDTSFLGLYDSGNSIPPDVNGASGPDHLMVTLNTDVRIQDRVGTDLGTVSLGMFWTELPGGGTFDPKILYDFEEDRWIFVTCSGSTPGESRIYMGVSANSDPAGEWYLYSYLADVTNQVWFDYPSMGFNDKWIVVSGNMFGNGFYSTVYVFDKHAMYAGAEVPDFTRFTTTQGFTLVPAITFDADEEDVYLISSANGDQGGNGYIRMFKVSGETAEPDFEFLGTVGTPNPWAGSVGGSGDFLPQMGSEQDINAVDHRMENVIMRNGKLWATHHVFLPANNPQRTAVQWWNLTPEGEILQWGRIDDPDGGMSYAFATIAVNEFEDVVIGFSAFSEEQYASAAYAFRYHDDPDNTFRAPYQYKDGLAPYYKTFGGGRNRWGDYSATMLDPVNSHDFWILQEYAELPSGGDRWATQWAYLRVAFEPQPDFTASEMLIPTGETIDFTDLTAGVPANWNWTFDGALPATSSDQNPLAIQYSTEGSFNVSLTAGNDFGENTTMKEAFITTSSTILPEVDFVASESLICTGAAVAFTDLSTYMPREWEWSFEPATVTFIEGTDAFSQNPVVVFDEPGGYSVSLTATNLNGGNTNTYPDMIVVGGDALPFVELFQELSFDDAGWEIWNPDGQNTWELTEVGGLNETTKAAMLDFTNYFAIGQRDRLISPPLNLTGFEQVNFTFKHAYAKRHEAYADSLIIYVSADCGESWTRIYGTAEDGTGNFATHPPVEGFVPTNVWDWCGVEWGADCITLSLNEWAGDSDVRVAFETYSFYGNPLYITSVELGATVLTAESDATDNRLQLSPNPTSGTFSLHKAQLDNFDKVEVLNASGQQVAVFTKVKTSQLFDLTHLSPGIYLVKVYTADEIMQQKLIIE